MRTRLRRLAGLALALATSAHCAPARQSKLEIGAAAPSFSLQGTDGRVHALSDYAAARALVIVFTCNHCPVSALYERRIQQLADDYRARRVEVVAINPENPKSLALKDLAFSDVSDSLDDMRTRATFRRLTYPYLYDGEHGATAAAFGITVLPQAFVFDAQRTLRYQGRIDDSVLEDRVKVRDLRTAIDAVLAGQAVPVANTRADGCPVTSPSDTEAATERAALTSEPVSLELVGPPELKKLRMNGTTKLWVVNFWATWCPPCLVEFPDLQTAYRMYRSRNVELVTVSIDVPDAKSGVLKLLNEQHASSTNRMFATDDTARLQDAFDPKLPAAVPFTMLVAPNGDVLDQQEGEVDMLVLRRSILANLPDDPRYPGLQAYWQQK